MYVAAQPPVWGPWKRPMWIGAIIVHTVGLFAGAAVTGALGFLIGTLLRHPPMWMVGTLAIVLAPFAARIIAVKLEGSKWRVPGHWSRMGHIGESTAFGFMVGTGVATALASPAFYLLAAWSIAAPHYGAVSPVFAAFGAGRAVPFVIAGIRAFRHDNDVGIELDEMVAFTGRLGIVEAMLLLTLAPILLLWST